MRLSGRIALFCALALTTGALSAVEKKNVPYYDSTRPASSMVMVDRGEIFLSGNLPKR